MELNRRAVAIILIMLSIIYTIDNRVWESSSGSRGSSDQKTRGPRVRTSMAGDREHTDGYGCW